MQDIKQLLFWGTLGLPCMVIAQPGLNVKFNNSKQLFKQGWAITNSCNILKKLVYSFVLTV